MVIETWFSDFHKMSIILTKMCYTLFYKQDYNEQYQVKTDKKPNKTETLKLNFC